MAWRLLQSVLILPVNVLGVIPALLLWAAEGSGWGARWTRPGSWRTWAALPLAAAGLALAVATMRNFVERGKGTPAPWDPPERLVVAGPYRRVRNPMMTGVFLMMGAEVLVTGSWAVAAWGGVLLLGNLVYIPLVEEPCLAVVELGHAR